MVGRDGRTARWIGVPVLVAGMTAAAAGQSASPPGAGGPANARPAGTAEVARDAAADAATRFPLIREGSRLVQVRGLVDRDPATGGLRLTIAEDDPQSPGHRLTLLPSSRLTELQLVLGTARDASLAMIVTGRVFVFDERNYLMLTHPAVPDERVLLEPPTGAAGDATGEGGRAGGDAANAETGADHADADDDDDSVDAISRDLERSVGAVGRRMPAGPATPPAGPEAAGIATGDLLPEGTRLVDRRGKIRRTGGGGYMIVFDADATGEVDPPMMLLPCRLLERLARMAAGAGDEAAVLISGEVTIHGGRNYLLPTVYRVPREITALRP